MYSINPSCLNHKNILIVKFLKIKKKRIKQLVQRNKWNEIGQNSEPASSI